MEPTREVADAVADAFANALENGYDFPGWTDEQIADDMLRCDATLENFPREQVIAAVHGLRQ